MKYKNVMYISFIILSLFIISGVYGEDISLETDFKDDIQINDENILNSNVEDNVTVGEISGDSSNIYFDVSASTGGNGRIDSPYIKLTSDRLKSGCTAYFKTGNYTLDKYKSISSSITLIGEGENTVINFNGIAFVVNGGYTLTLKNITLSNAIVKNGGTLIATDTIFRDGIAVFNKTGIDYGNTQGGAIYSIGTSPKSTLTNCDFVNNYAAYGGSIYVEKGTLTISNCNFINSTAKNFGGAISAVESSSVTTTNAKFINCSSLGDTGGAIYAEESSLKVTKNDFINCYAHFGGAICSLKSSLTVISSNFINNTAKYEAGAIYKMYGTDSISDSTFKFNTALNGGALYLDNATSTVINSQFYSNVAKNYGGAIYANFITLTTSTDTFSGNTAKVSNNIYTQNNNVFEIGSSNYQMFVNNYTFAGLIPSRYSLVDEGYVSKVKDQEDGGNCWAFASIAALESCILKASNYTYDLSEENLKNLMEYYSAYGWKRDTNEGGFDEMAIGYLTSWLGPVLEEDDAYDDHSKISTVINSVMHVQNVVYLPVRSSYTDLTELKKAILTYGAVVVGVNYDSSYFNKNTASYYYKGLSSYANHAVTIVGWDDNFDKSKFKNTPSGNGAFIVKNSWNTDWGDEGYFYISYYDPIVYKVGYKHEAYTFLLNDTIRFNKNYQYDIAGPTDFYDTDEKTIYIKNIFQSTGDDLLAAVSTYFDTKLSYTISIYVNNALKLTQSGSSNPGYYTINLKQFVPLKKGDEFEVVFKLTGSKDVYIAICEKSSVTRVFGSKDLSYISTDGTSWKDLYGYKEHWWQLFTRSYQVACIKAFTKADILQTSLCLNNVNGSVDEDTYIIANVLDENGNLINFGNVTFTVNNNTYDVAVVDGNANLTMNFNNSGTFVIDAVYNSNENYESSTNSSLIQINRKNIGLLIDSDNIIYGNDLLVNLSLSEKLNSTIQVYVNKKYETVNLTNGEASVIFSDLAVGKYTIFAVFMQDEKYNTVVSRYDVEVFEKEIIKNNSSLKVYASDISYGENLLVEASLPGLDNENVSVFINDKIYNIEIINGSGSLYVDDLIDCGSYEVIASFNGNSNYLNSSFVTNFKVNKAQSSLFVSTSDISYGDDEIINIRINDNITDDIKIIIDSTEEYATIVNGELIITNNNLSVGIHSINVVFEGNNNYLNSSAISVFKVNKASLNFDVKTSQCVYGEYLKVYGVVSTEDDVNLTFIINDVVYNTVVKEGIFEFDVSNLNAGEYVLSVRFNGNKNFYKTSSSVIANVSKAKSEISIDVVDNLINISSNFDDDVRLIIDGDEEIVNSNVILDKGDLSDGVHNIEVIFDGNDNYLNSSKKSSFETKLVQHTFNITTQDITYGEDLVINASLSVHENVNITFLVNNIVRIVESSNGICQLKLSDLDAGNYTIIGSVIGNDFKLTSKTVAEVNKAQSFISVSTQDITFGENEEISINLNTDAGVSLIVNSTSQSVNVADGIATVYMSDLDAGKYLVKVVFDGNNNYFACDNESYFEVHKITNFSINCGNITICEDNEFKIELECENITGQLIMDIDGKSYAGNVVNNKVIFNVESLNEGEYTYKIYSTDKNYDLKNFTGILTVENDKNVILFVSDLEKFYKGSERFEIMLADNRGNSLKNKTVHIILNGVDYSRITDGDGKASIAINLESGVYDVITVFDGDSDYNSISQNNSILIKNTVISKDLTKVYRNESQYIVRILDSKGNVVTNGSVEFNINGVFYNRSINSSGFAKLNINLDQGKYIITSINPVTGEMHSNLITVLPRITENHDFSMYYRNGSKYVVRLIGDDGNPVAGENVTFNINGVFYTRTSDNDGYARLNINLDPGDYIITAEYKQCKVSNKITVKPILSANNLVMNYLDGSKFVVNLVDGRGNILPNVNITFNINGVFYNRITDNEGNAKLNINLQKGEYIITSAYETARLSNKILIN